MSARDKEIAQLVLLDMAFDVLSSALPGDCHAIAERMLHRFQEGRRTIAFLRIPMLVGEVRVRRKGGSD